MTNFQDIVFDSDSHTYKIGSTYLSPVTSIIKRIVPEFNSDAILSKLSASRGIPKDVIKAEWDEKRDFGLARGTKVHNYIENVLDGNDTTVMKNMNDCTNEIKQFDIAWNMLRSKFDVKFVRKEWTVGDVELGIAGRIDAVIDMSIDSVNRRCLFDWKTGGFVVRRFAKENLLPPFDDLPCCEEVKYSIQLSLYRLLVERNTDERIHNCHILHLPDSGSFSLFNVIDLRDRLERWLLDGGIAQARDISLAAQLDNLNIAAMPDEDRLRLLKSAANLIRRSKSFLLGN